MISVIDEGLSIYPRLTLLMGESEEDKVAIDHQIQTE
jgi:hypothetical protein